MTADLQSLSGSSVIIIGGLGFIGSNLAHRLVALGANVLLLDSMNPLYGGNMHNIAGIADKVRLNISDVRDRYSLAHLLRGQEYVFNLAGQTSHMDSMSDPLTDMEINAGAQLSLLETCRKHAPDCKIVFTSTRQVYGRPQYLPVDEAHPVKPVDVNGINKVAGESYHSLYNEVYGLRTTVLRLTNTFGPRMRIKDARQTFLGEWIRRSIEGEPFEVWGGRQRRDYNYVDDVVDALLLASVTPGCEGQVLNIGGHEVLTLSETAEILCAVWPKANCEFRDFPIERKAIDIGDYFTDFSCFTAFTGWHPRISFREGLCRTLEYCISHRKHYV